MEKVKYRRGLPILEAQQVGVPVVTSRNSSLKEIAKKSALLVDPHSAADIAEQTYRILTDEKVYNDLITAGRENIKRFDWKKAAELTARVILADLRK